MRSLVNGRKIILENDTTNTGGTVLYRLFYCFKTQGYLRVIFYCPLKKLKPQTIEGITKIGPCLSPFEGR